MKRFLVLFLMLCFSMQVNYSVVKAECNHVWVPDPYSCEEPTCVSDGYQWYNCYECGEYKIENIPATGIHKWSEWVADGYLCCDGLYERSCNECYIEETKPRQATISHTWSDWLIYSESTCSYEGEKSRHCNRCYTEEVVKIPKDSKKHSWSDWYYTKKPTALKKGEKERECYDCSLVEKKICSKLKAKLTLKDKKKTLKVGKKYTIKIKYLTYGDKIKSFKSNNKKVATVTQNGKVTAKKKGTAIITVTMKSGCKAKIKIIVK